MRPRDDDEWDAVVDDMAYRQWKRDQIDDTPVEARDRVDVSREAYARDMQEDHAELDDDEY